MNGPHQSCSICSRPIESPAPDHADRAWSDPARIRAQGWVQSPFSGLTCLRCLSADEANFLLDEPAPSRDAGGRFALLPVALDHHLA